MDLHDRSAAPLRSSIIKPAITIQISIGLNLDAAPLRVCEEFIFEKMSKPKSALHHTEARFFY